MPEFSERAIYSVDGLAIVSYFNLRPLWHEGITSPGENLECEPSGVYFFFFFFFYLLSSRVQDSSFTECRGLVSPEKQAESGYTDMH